MAVFVFACRAKARQRGCRSGFWSPVDSTGVPEPDLEGGATKRAGAARFRLFAFLG